MYNATGGKTDFSFNGMMLRVEIAAKYFLDRSDASRVVTLYSAYKFEAFIVICFARFNQISCCFPVKRQRLPVSPYCSTSSYFDLEQYVGVHVKVTLSTNAKKYGKAQPYPG